MSHRFGKTRSQEEGFTLVELMVVVLIIAILLAIAIPTFLGARSRAQNRSTESNLRNALTAEKTVYSDNQIYVSATSVQTAEPSLAFQTAAPSAGTNQVQVTLEGTTAGDGVCLVALSTSGNYYGIFDASNAEASPGLQSTGTFYGGGSSTAPTCPTATSGGAVTTPASGWSTTPSAAGW